MVPFRFRGDILKGVCLLSISVLSIVSHSRSCRAQESFHKRHCHECHSQESSAGGLDLTALDLSLNDPASFERWVRIYDRVVAGEMPPADADQPTKADRTAFTESLRTSLHDSHLTQKGTVLRRLNRREYQNTLNDLFGTDLDLADMLPEDGRSHEFDTVGEALGISMVQLQRYMDAMRVVLDSAIANTSDAPRPVVIEASYAKTREAEQFVGKKWKKLSDGAVVRFSSGGYPSGMLRGSGVRERGRYRIRVTGYAHQSEQPIAFSVGGTSFAPGSEKPIYGFFSVPPDEPTTIELEANIESRYMIAIEPYAIADPKRYQRNSIDEYDGPGLAIKSVVLEGPLRKEFPGRGHKLLFDGIKRQEIPPRNPNDRKKSWYQPKFEVLSQNEQADAEQSLHRVATAAFRRSVTDNEIVPYVELFQSEREEGVSFEDSLRTAVSAIFCSPKFLYLQESAGRLDDFALASRLSYFLTRSTPDRELLSLAATGELGNPETLRKQTERLLEHPHNQRFMRDFTDSWLNLREIDFTAPDQQLFPEFDPYLRYSMPLETEAFLRELIDENLPVANIVKSDFAMINSRLAELYEIPDVSGTIIQKVNLPENSLRGGILTQSSILKVTANGTNTSPVVRGVWVMERILGETPQPPPPGIPGVEPDIRGATTLREILAKHRNVESCNACHRRIDPPGFALECFNPIGGFRDRYRSLGNGDKVAKEVLGRQVRYRLGPEVDCSGERPGGQQFENFQQFRDDLAQDQDLLARTLAKKLLTFGTGRELGFSDRPEIERVVQESAKRGYGIRDLIHLVVTSEIFRSK